jgi:hypothetical protein
MNIEMLNWLKAAYERDFGRMKKIRGDKPFGVIIHECMEIPQGNSLCSYLYCKQAKMSYFSFLFSLLQNQRTGGRNGGLY